MSKSTTQADLPSGDENSPTNPIPLPAGLIAPANEHPDAQPTTTTPTAREPIAKPVAVKLPGQPRVAAGSKIPGASALKIRKWMATVSQVAALEPGRQKMEESELRKESLSLRYRA